MNFLKLFFLCKKAVTNAKSDFSVNEPLHRHKTNKQMFLLVNKFLVLNWQPYYWLNGFVGNNAYVYGF